MLGTILLIAFILLLLGALPNWITAAVGVWPERIARHRDHLVVLWMLGRF